MHRGLLALTFERNELAERKFLKSLNTGNIYDPRVRKECLLQLQKLLARKGIYNRQLELMLKKFQKRNRDFVFLVDHQQDMVHN